MTMKWNIEWIDLKNIEHMIAECWRMNNRQLQSYYRELSQQQELIFAGELGITFLELVRRLIDGSADYDWPELQKDVHMLQKLIQNGLQQDEAYWKEQYKDLVEEPEFYFYTKLGSTFTECLAEKLKLNITEAQKLLLHDLTQIQKICTSVDLENEIKVQKTISFLTQKNKNFFFSWLGKSFVNELQERFGRPEETALPQKKTHKVLFNINKKSAKKLFTFFIFISISFMIGLLAVQLQETKGGMKLHEFIFTAKARTGAAALQNTADDAETKETPLQTTADKNNNNDNNDNNDNKIKNTLQTQDTLPQKITDTQIQDTLPQKTTDTKTQDTLPQKTTDTKIQDTSLATKPAALSPEPAETFPEILPQYQAFHNTYPDLFGWLKIPDTEIDVPVMQSDDKEKGEKYYYLHRNYMGQASEEGSLFVDTKSSCYPQDDNTVIYGHNMNNGRIFGTLDQFADPDFFRSHQTIQYDTIYETGTYQAAAVLKSRVLYQEEEGFRYYRFFNYHTDSEFQECLDFIKQHQLFETGEELEYGDQLLMLSTCEYSQENGRLVIVAKRIE